MIMINRVNTQNILNVIGIKLFYSHYALKLNLKGKLFVNFIWDLIFFWIKKTSIGWQFNVSGKLLIVKFSF